MDTSFQCTVNKMNDAKLWHLHGLRYDLEPFLEKHPGGKSILIATRGLRDATPLFESYHAFANRASIREQLKQYQLDGPGWEPLYSYNGFYETLVQRAREAFGAKSDSDNVVRKVKANTWWWVKISLEVILMCICWIATFVNPPFADSSRWRWAIGFVTGFVFISLGFNTMHDASHFAIKPRNHWVNGLFLRAWTAWALWSGSYWMTHHVVRHHAFTGHPELDPDIQHARPFVRKSLETSREKYISLPRLFSKVWHFAILTASVFAVLPGMFVGQILSYSIVWPLRKHLWKMAHPARGSFDRHWWETSLSLTSLLSHFLFAPSIASSLGFLVGCNIAYAICILPDHDTFESVVENHMESGTSSLPDWGEVQVRHSSDFGKGFWGRAFGEAAGGINYQIVHHLFPGVSHVHFPMLTKVVEDTCKEFNVPFVRHDSLTSALLSVAKTFSLTMAPVKSVESFESTVVTPAAEVLSKRILSEEMIKNLKNDRHRRQQRGMGLATGMLFGSWLALCVLAISVKGHHLLAVPATLTAALLVYWRMGSFTNASLSGKRCAVDDVIHCRTNRFSNLQMASARIAFFIALLAIDNLASLDYIGLPQEYIVFMGTGMFGAELFAIVMSGTFVLCPRRVISDTLKLIMFTVISYRGPDTDVCFPLLLLLVDHFLSLMLRSSLVAWASSLVIHATAGYFLASLMPLGAALVAINSSLIVL